MNDEGRDPGDDPAIEEPAITEPAVLGIAEAAAADPRNRQRAGVLIDEQIKLAAMQRQHLHIQHVRDRFLVAFDLALAVAGLVVIVVIVALIWDAWRSRSVIVDAFDVPAGFAAHGLSGKVVASQLLDHLKSFQDATRTNQEKRAVEDTWSNRIEVRITESGISIEEIEALLHRWLSRDEYISGSVVDAGPNLVLTVRGDRFPARSFAGKDLDALTVKAAEYLYGSSEPYLFSVYLSEQGRDPEAIALARSAFARASATDKPLLLNVWANSLANLGHYREALDKAQDAVRLKPDFWLGYDTMMGMQMSLGAEEAVVQTGRDMEQRARRGAWLPARVPSAYWENLDYLLSDWTAFHRDIQDDMRENGGQGSEVAADPPIDAWALAQMHDWHGAEFELETTPAGNQDKFVMAQSAFVRASVALDRGDYSAAAALMHKVDDIASRDSAVASEIVPPVACWLALAGTKAGVDQNADTEIERGGHFVDCYRFKGDIADQRGDWEGAQKSYAAAVALAPSVAAAYESWGEALVRHGQIGMAMTRFSEAHDRGPHWADPLERWGELLGARGDNDQATRKYEEAAVLAPNWGHLYVAWGRALDRLHRHAEAVEKFHRAMALDLSRAERLSLTACCGS